MYIYFMNAMFCIVMFKLNLNLEKEGGLMEKILS